MAPPLMAKDDAINTLYREFASAYQQLDRSRIEQQYLPQALMMGVSEKRPFVEGRDNILAAYDHWFTKVANRQGSIEIRFRGSNRVHYQQVVVDAGYYQIRYQPEPSSGEAPTQFGGKYQFTLLQNGEGRWQILADSVSRVEQQLFVDSKPVSGLVYDDAFAIIAASSANKD